MAYKKSGVNKSEEIRKLLRANPKIKAREIKESLAQKNIEVASALIYFVKGRLHGRKGRRRRLKTASNAAAAHGSGDVLAMIRKVKDLAMDLGGMKKLKALVDALNE